MCCCQTTSSIRARLGGLVPAAVRVNPDLRAKLVAQQATLQQRQAQAEQRRLQRVAADEAAHRAQKPATE